jgi:hypothetical protein
VTRALETRLTGLETGAERSASAAVRQRHRLRATAKICAAVRAGLVQSGIDLAGAAALRRCEAEIAERVSPGEEPELAGVEEKFKAPDGDGLAGDFAAKLGDMAQRYLDGHELDFAKASMAELLAWCLARPAVEPDNGSARLGEPTTGGKRRSPTRDTRQPCSMGDCRVI